jgi:hypothetical protein
MPSTPQITIAGNLADLFGDAETATLIVQLCVFGSQLPRVSGTAVIAQTAPLAITATGGAYSFKLWGNDVILPAGTFYTIRVVDANGNAVQINAYQFSGTETVDLSSATPYNPPPLPPSPAIAVLTNPPGAATQTIHSSIVIDGDLEVTGSINFSASIIDVVPSGGEATFDLSAGTVFRIVLDQNVTTVNFNEPTPGASYTFIIVQDGTGDWEFTWPASALNAITPVNPVADGKTVWSAICDSDDTLMSPGYYP